MTGSDLVPSPTEVGLTEVEARLLHEKFGPNAIPEQPSPRVWSRVITQLRDPMIILLLGAAVLTAVLRDFTDLTVIAVVVVLNTVVGVAQELRAENALAALRRLTAPTARVVRDGRQQMRDAVDLVPGDVVVLEAGDVVPADLSLLDAARLQVDEAALTGESVPVEKDHRLTTGDHGVVHAGTVVTRGRATGLVTGTGVHSALGRIAQLLAAQRPRPTPLQLRLAALGRTLALAAVLLSAVVAVSGLLRGRPPLEVVLTAVSLAVAAVPESLPAVITLALALGARRMARHAAIVRRLPAVETLGSVTVVATDKTGTLTEGRMRVERLWTAKGEYEVHPSPDGRVPVLRRVDGTGRCGDLESCGAGAGELLRDVVLCNDAVPGPDGAGSLFGDPMERSLVDLARAGGVQVDRMRDDHPRVDEVPFDSARRRMTTVHGTGEPGCWLVVCKGAPEVLLDRGGLVAAGEEPERARVVAGRLARRGYRVLAVGHRTVHGATPPQGSAETEKDLVLAGLVAVIDPPRDNAADVVAAVQDAGVALLLITGDHPETARALAERVGIDGGGQAVVTGDELEAGLSPDRTEAARLFARTRPEQKLDIVHAWQERGHVVAMTGDGVNDGPALRRADIGVAMGRDGTEVARQAADLVLTDDDLRTVVTAIGEGRRIYANVRTFLRYALAGGLAEVLVMLLGPAVGAAVPLLPAQILWVNMLTHGLPGVALGAEPGDPSALGDRPRSPQESVLGGGLWRQITWVGLLIASLSLAVAWWAGATGRPVQTLTFFVLGLAQLGVALALRARTPQRRRGVRFLDVAVAAAVLLQLAGVYVAPVQALLGTQALDLSELAVAGVAAAVPGMAVVVARRIGRRLRTPGDQGGTSHLAWDVSDVVNAAR